jgi:hypothetical protein
MLFILAMDPLQRLLDMATHHGVLTTLPLTAARWRTSMYADDAAIFINPLREDLEAITAILHEFGIVSGLHINMQKSSVHPIRCQDIDLDHVLASFTGTKASFPCRYLGLQLHMRSLQKVHVQPLIERIGQRLPGWKGKMLNRAGRHTLVTTVLSSMPTYHLTVFPVTVWARKKIDKIRRSFLWKGEENANGGHCLVNGPTICMPKDLGAWECRTWKDLGERCASVSYGRNGQMTPNHGWEQKYHVRTLIASYSTPPRRSQSGTATKLGSGITPG